MNKSSELHKLIYCSQKKDNACLELLCQKFEPLIKKYCYYLNYEDAYGDLFEYFINCINKIPLEKESFNDDKYILSYIKISIKNAFIYFNKKNQKYFNNNYFPEDDTIFETSLNSSIHFFQEKDKVLLMDMKKFLTQDEFILFSFKVLNRYTDAEIGKFLGITRQAVNKQFNKLTRKIKESYY